MSYFETGAEAASALGLPLLLHVEADPRFLVRHDRLSRYAAPTAQAARLFHRLGEVVAESGSGFTPAAGAALWIAGPYGSLEHLPWAVGLADHLARRGAAVYLGEREASGPLQALGSSAPRSPLSFPEAEALYGGAPLEVATSDLEGVRILAPARTEGAGGGARPRPDSWILLADSLPEALEGPYPPATGVRGVLLAAAFRDHSKHELETVVRELRAAGHQIFGLIAIGPMAWEGAATAPAAAEASAAAKPAPPKPVVPSAPVPRPAAPSPPVPRPAAPSPPVPRPAPPGPPAPRPAAPVPAELRPVAPDPAPPGPGPRSPEPSAPAGPGPQPRTPEPEAPEPPSPAPPDSEPGAPVVAPASAPAGRFPAPPASGAPAPSSERRRRKRRGGHAVPLPGGTAPAGPARAEAPSPPAPSGPPVRPADQPEPQDATPLSERSGDAPAPAQSAAPPPAQSLAPPPAQRPAPLPEQSPVPPSAQSRAPLPPDATPPVDSAESTEPQSVLLLSNWEAQSRRATRRRRALAVLSFVGVTALVGFTVYLFFLRPLGVRPSAAPASRGDSDRSGERAASPAEGIGRIDSTAGAESVEAGRTSGAAADTVPFVSPDVPPEEGSAYPAATGAGGPASGEGATRPAGLPAPEGERRSADAPADGAGAGTLPAGSPPGAAGRDAWRTASPLPPGALSPETRPAERPSPRSPSPEPPSPETRTATPPPGAAPAPDRPRETPASDEPRIEPRSTEPAASDRSGAGPGSPEESPSGEGGVREQAPRDQLPPEESSPAVSAAADTSGRGPRAAAPAGHGPGPFSIHLSSFKLEAEARAEVEQLRSERRLAARALLVTVPGRGSWYRILLGDFATFDEAEKEALALQERGVVPYAHVAGEGGRGTPVPVGAQDQ